MSESHPTYIPCAAGNRLQSDCLVRRKGDLIEFLGHPAMDFIPEDGLELVATVQRIALDILNERPHENAD